MKLLLITQDFPPDYGGIHTYCYELVQQFSAMAEEVTVIAPAKAGSASADETLPAKVIRIRCSDILLGFALWPRIKKILNETEPDVIFHAQWNTLVASARARRLGFTGKVVCAAHGRELLLGGKNVLANRILNLYRKPMLRLPDLWLPVSRYTAGLLDERHGISGDGVKVVSNGTDPLRYRTVSSSFRERFAIREDEWLLVTAARLVKRKGVEDVIEAVNLLKERHPGLKCLIAGNGPEKARLEQLTRQNGTAGRIEFTGKIPFDELPAFYSAANAFVMVPRTLEPDVEGFGIVYLEANACGLPVIGSRSGGVPDAVIHEHTGLLVGEARPDQLAAAVERLIRNPEEARRFGQQGRERVVQSFTWSHTASAILRHIAE
jgi:phosphatidylinositol alpha-1,6-mannosyltransferase